MPRPAPNNRDGFLATIQQMQRELTELQTWQRTQYQRQVMDTPASTETTSATPILFPAYPPSLVVSAAGEYEIGACAEVQMMTATVGTLNVGIYNGASLLVGMSFVATGQYGGASLSRAQVDGLAANTTLTMKISVSAGTGRFSGPVLWAQRLK